MKLYNIGLKTIINMYRLVGLDEKYINKSILSRGYFEGNEISNIFRIKEFQNLPESARVLASELIIFLKKLCSIEEDSLEINRVKYENAVISMLNSIMQLNLTKDCRSVALRCERLNIILLYTMRDINELNEKKLLNIYSILQIDSDKLFVFYADSPYLISLLALSLIDDLNIKDYEMFSPGTPFIKPGSLLLLNEKHAFKGRHELDTKQDFIIRRLKYTDGKKIS